MTQKKVATASLCVLAAVLSCARMSYAQVKKEAKKDSDSLTAKSVKANGDLKSFKEIITEKAITKNGFFKVHQVDQKFYFEIPDTLFDRDLLVVNRISKSSALIKKNMSGFAGDLINENVIRFVKGNKNKVYIAMVPIAERASDTAGMYRSVLNSSLPSYVAAFDIKAYHVDSVNQKGNAAVIDMTDYLNADNEVFYFRTNEKRTLGVAAQQSDRSFISEIRAFPLNIEIKAVKTYTTAPLIGPAGTALDVATLELNSSVVLLPAVPMKPRFADSRVGYFSTGYIDFDENPHGVKRKEMITRWRLEPKPEDREKYLKGQLVEPEKPIVFYIDPATPQKWVPYLIAGVNDWQVAFEQAGFKNAIMAKRPPADSSWSIDDARHSAIVYKPSVVANAMGPHVHDPRSGEIMEAHVSWFHNVMDLLQRWYFIQAGAIDPGVRRKQLNDTLMGELIRFVASHEVGHTLGLMHNYGASSTVPVEKLRDKKWVEANGHTPSIMDYARFNYVAQPEDSIGAKGIYPRVGDYDKWAIEWGYKWMPQLETEKQEAHFLNKWIIERVGKDRRLWFGSELDKNDPRCQNEDLGNDAMLAGTYGIKNLRRILPNVVEWTKEEGDGYEAATRMYNEVVAQFGRYIGHVTKNIGGIYTDIKTVDEPGLTYCNVPPAIQKKALAFLDKEVFQTPLWVIPSQFSGKINYKPANVISGLQKSALDAVLNVVVFNNLLNATTSTTPAYTIEELLADVKKSVWQELRKGTAIDIYRRNLQKQYVVCLKKILTPLPASATPMHIQLLSLVNVYTNDIADYILNHCKELKAEIDKAAIAQTGITKYHLHDLSKELSLIIEPPK